MSLSPHKAAVSHWERKSPGNRQVSQGRADMLNSPTCSNVPLKGPHHPGHPLCPNPSPARPSRVSPLGSIGRNTSEPWALSLPEGEQKQDGVRTPKREDERRWVSSPHGLLSAPPGPQASQPSTLSCSLSVAPSFFTCGKRHHVRGRGSRVSHEMPEETLILDRKEGSRTLRKNPEKDQE